MNVCNHGVSQRRSGFFPNRAYKEMKDFLIDAMTMAIVALLVFLYLDREVEAIIVFGIGLIGLRQARRLISVKLQRTKDNSKNANKAQRIRRES